MHQWCSMFCSQVSTPPTAVSVVSDSRCTHSRAYWLWIYEFPLSLTQALLLARLFLARVALGVAIGIAWCMYFFVVAIFWFAIAFALPPCWSSCPCSWAPWNGPSREASQWRNVMVEWWRNIFQPSWYRPHHFLSLDPAHKTLHVSRSGNIFWFVKGHRCLKKRYCWWRAEFLLATLNVDTVYTWMENTDHWLQHFQPPKVRLDQTQNSAWFGVETTKYGYQKLNVGLKVRWWFQTWLFPPDPWRRRPIRGTYFSDRCVKHLFGCY